jgi:hypothetical protein
MLKNETRKNRGGKVLRAAIFLVLLSATVFAQGFPWEIFKLRTLKEVIASTTKATGPDHTVFLAHDQLESKVAVVFTGKSRPISEARKTFINLWFKILRSEQQRLGGLYVSEYLYKEGETEYWLPTSTPITKYFDKELKPGDLNS